MKKIWRLLKIASPSKLLYTLAGVLVLFALLFYFRSAKRAARYYVTVRDTYLTICYDCKFDNGHYLRGTQFGPPTRSHPGEWYHSIADNVEPFDLKGNLVIPVYGALNDGPRSGFYMDPNKVILIPKDDLEGKETLADVPNVIAPLVPAPVVALPTFPIKEWKPPLTQELQELGEGRYKLTINPSLLWPDSKLPIRGHSLMEIKSVTDDKVCSPPVACNGPEGIPSGLFARFERQQLDRPYVWGDAIYHELIGRFDSGQQFRVGREQTVSIPLNATSVSFMANIRAFYLNEAGGGWVMEVKLI